MKKKTAIIDIGSNTIRLVIYSYDQKRGLREFENIKIVARLRTYIQKNGEMSEEGIQLLEEILKSFRQMLKDYNVQDVLATATAAIRQATNQVVIVNRMKEQTDFEIDVLTGEEEAYFGFLAVAHSVPNESAVTIDIGGGSTEITYFVNKKLQKTHSFPFGVVTLQQQFMKEDKITFIEKKQLALFAEAQFRSLPWLSGLNLPVIGIGGSARNIAQIDQQRKQYPISSVHQYKMKVHDVNILSDTLSDLSFSDLKKIDGLSSDRADIILPALEVFRALMKVVEANEFMFSGKGLREGIMLNRVLYTNPEALDKNKVFEHSCDALAAEYEINQQEAKHLQFLAQKIYLACSKNKMIQESPGSLQLLKRAAALFYLGEYIDAESASQHTFYILSNRSIDGLDHLNRVKLALVASYKNKENFKRYAAPFEQWIDKNELKHLRDLGAILKFAYGLNGSKRSIVNDVLMESSKDGVKLKIYVDGNAMAEEYQAGKQKKHLERLCKCEVNIQFIVKDGESYD
ncbi:Ppx/GppA family phosphatase [Paenisporosarcina antarctica]|uniref:Ppx/GppA family phosphatase n=1 Tax=Paenisporosarcina antarctica TaxID=417367 RepID=A0A4P7A175_9BACL|nr:Ppx/GppA family phosphatase [Paenisporosarcina antarctica]QBP41626.1 Ppx/GppA family phosphatase [Paenisporosarcina antarctica]